MKRLKYSGLQNPVFLEKLNSANGPSQIQTVMQTLLSFDKENLNRTWIQLFEKVKKELIALIRDHADEGEQAVDLLMVTKYFERIGDHATNIAEWVIFSITGQIVA